MSNMRLGGLEDDANGIRLTMLEEPSHPDVDKLQEYWRQAGGMNVTPPHNAIDPIRIPKLLPYVLIVDELPPAGRDHIRLFGTGLVQMFGEDRTGQRFGEIARDRYSGKLGEVVQDRWSGVLLEVLQERTPVYATTRLINLDKAYTRIHIGAFPLTDPATADAPAPDIPRITRILGIIRPG